MGFLFNFFVAAFAAIGSFLFGYDSGIIGSVISPNFIQFHSYFNNPGPNITGAIVSTFAGGCFFGAWAAGAMADRIGRKRTIQVGSLVAVIGCSLQTGARNVSYLLVGRVVAGLAIGVLSMIVPLYQSEISPPHLRGFLTGMTQFMIGLGFLAANWIGYGCQFFQTDAQWRVPLGVQIAPAVLLFIGMLFLPFSPRWLIKQGREDEAKRSLEILHGTSTNQEFIELEYREMVEQIKYEEEHLTAKLSDLWATKAMLKRTLTGMGIQICTQFTGINVSAYFQPSLYAALGYSGNQILLITGINGLLGTVVTFTFISLFLDRFGRKPPLIIGAIGMVISLSVEAAINARFASGSNPAAQKAGVAFIIIFGSLFFSISFGPVSWVYQSEIFPMRVRALGTSVSTMANWACNVLISQISPIGLANLGYKFYIVFIVANTINGLVVWLFFPETKGKTLEEMDAIFGDQVIPHALEQKHPEAHEKGSSEKVDAFHQEVIV